MQVPMPLKGLTEINKKFYNSKKRFLVVAAGRRSRKTLIGTRRILLAALSTPNVLFALAAPTRQQAKNIFWLRLKHDTQSIRIGKSESELSITLPNKTQIYIAGLDRPQTDIEGRSLAGILVTEVADMKRAAWTEAIRPALADQKGFAILESVPGGRAYFYELATYAAGGVLPVVEAGIGAYAESDYDPDWCFFSWFSEDVLDKDEIAAAKRQMDERTFNQEFRAEFLAVGGSLYYVFDPTKHVKPMTTIEEEPIYLTCDFNKSPMVFLVAQHIKDTLYFVDELAIGYDAKTQALAHDFILKYGKRKNKTVYLTGDTSNQFESHRDRSSDYVIISDILSNAGFVVINRVMRKNPNINNRVNVVNSLLHQGRMFISNSCHRLGKDMDQVTGDGKGAKDKSDPALTHASDAMDYLVWLLFSKEFYRRQK